MKEETAIILDGKETKAIIARYLGVEEKDVKPLRYNFAVTGITAEEIRAKLGEEKKP